jgi:hypothetical protein
MQFRPDAPTFDPNLLLKERVDKIFRDLTKEFPENTENVDFKFAYDQFRKYETIIRFSKLGGQVKISIFDRFKNGDIRELANDITIGSLKKIISERNAQGISFVPNNEHASYKLDKNKGQYTFDFNQDLGVAPKKTQTKKASVNPKSALQREFTFPDNTESGDSVYYLPESMSFKESEDERVKRVIEDIKGKIKSEGKISFVDPAIPSIFSKHGVDFHSRVKVIELVKKLLTEERQEYQDYLSKIEKNRKTVLYNMVASILVEDGFDQSRDEVIKKLAEGKEYKIRFLLHKRYPTIEELIVRIKKDIEKKQIIEKKKKEELKVRKLKLEPEIEYSEAELEMLGILKRKGYDKETAKKLLARIKATRVKK